jgi:hypothetical protein
LSDTGELTLGAEIDALDGTFGTVEAVMVVADAQPMYNLTVDTAHTFFVGDGQWLVHNTNCAPNPHIAAAERAKTLAEESVENLHLLYPTTKNRPTAYSVAVSTRTGNVYRGQSGAPIPKGDEIHPTLANRMPNSSLTNWPVANCAEFKACNLALFAGENLEDLAVYTVRVSNGSAYPRCLNCKITTYGAYIVSD